MKIFLTTSMLLSAAALASASIAVAQAPGTAAPMAAAPAVVPAAPAAAPTAAPAIAPAATTVAPAAQPAAAPVASKPPVAAALPAAAIPAVAPAAAPVAALVLAPSNALVLRQGTALRFATDQALSSQKSKVGDRFELRTIDPVMVGQLLVIPAGTRAVGEVTRAEKKGAFGKSGKLDTRILYVVMGDQRIAVTGKSIDQGSSGTVGVVAAAVLFWPAMPFITGKSAELPVGTAMSGYVENDLPLVAAAPAAVAPLVVPAAVASAPAAVASAPAAVASAPAAAASAPAVAAPSATKPAPIATPAPPPAVK